MEESSHRFRFPPWNLWTTAFILLIFDMLTTYVLYYTYTNSAYNIFVLSLVITFYILCFTLLYQGEIEYFTINRKKAFVKKSKVNIFGSKKDKIELNILMILIIFKWL